MKFHKKYHSRTSDEANPWAYAWKEEVDIDPSFASSENENFHLTGVKYEAIEQVAEQPDAPAADAPAADAPAADAPAADAPAADAPAADAPADAPAQ